MNKIGYWVPEKKRKKLNFDALRTLCQARGTELVQLDLQRPLQEQGPFSVIVHKLTDVVTQASQGDNKAKCMLENLETYIKSHPDVIVLDQLESVKKLMDRNVSYQVLQDSLQSHQDIQRVVRVPNFVEIHTTKETEIKQRLLDAHVGFPLVCKPSQAHGSVISHKMALIFNEAGLKDIKPPCVAQTFINHNALLHKVFVVGDQYFVVRRPSVKNFTAGSSDQGTIFFDSHDVSKPNSTSFLNELDETDTGHDVVEPSSALLRALANSLHQGLGMALFGADVIVENHTGIHYVIDVNAFPGYDGVPDFMNALFNYVERLLGLPDATTNGSSSLSSDEETRPNTHRDSELSKPNGLPSKVRNQLPNHVVGTCVGSDSEESKPLKRPHRDVFENGLDCGGCTNKRSSVTVNANGDESK